MFTCRPKLSSKAGEKANNMEVFWSLLSTVLLKCNSVARRKRPGNFKPRLKKTLGFRLGLTKNEKMAGGLKFRI